MADLANGNGTLKNRILTGGAVALISAVVSFLTGGAQTVVSHGQRITVLETQMTNQASRLERIENKLDAALSHGSK